MIVNLRESLNTRDRKSVNGNSKYYDLVNLYESCNLSADNKKTLAKMINNNASDKAIYSFLYECYEGKEDIKEDTVKKDGKWVNKGKEGTHGEFKTKKAADAQRKAMFANGYKGESLKETLSMLDKRSIEEIDGVRYAYDYLTQKDLAEVKDIVLKLLRKEFPNSTFEVYSITLTYDELSMGVLKDDEDFNRGISIKLNRFDYSDNLNKVLNKYTPQLAHELIDEMESESLKESLNLNEVKNIINVLNKNLGIRFKHSAGGIFSLDRTPFNEDTFNKLIKNNYKMLGDILEEQGLKYDISEDAYISKDENLYVTIYGDTSTVIVQFEEMESESLKESVNSDIVSMIKKQFPKATVKTSVRKHSDVHKSNPDTPVGKTKYVDIRITPDSASSVNSILQYCNHNIKKVLDSDKRFEYYGDVPARNPRGGKEVLLSYHDYSSLSDDEYKSLLGESVAEDLNRYEFLVKRYGREEDRETITAISLKDAEDQLNSDGHVEYWDYLPDFNYDEVGNESLNEDTQLKFDDDMINDIEVLHMWRPEEVERILIKHGSDKNNDNWVDGLDLPAAYDEIMSTFRDKYSDYDEIDYDVAKVLGLVEESLSEGKIIELSSDWRFVDSKPVPDSNGFMHDYVWYENTKDGRHVFVFGDKDLYDDVDLNQIDWEVDSYSEARRWFDSYNGFDEDTIEESLDESKSIKVFGAKAKNQNEAEEILYVIKDSHGNQLSKPNADDSELWDRVASMEARGRRGLYVVVYTGKKESLAEDKGQPRSNRYTTYFNRIKRAIEKGDEETLKRTKEAIMYAPAKELKNSEARELMNMIKNRKITESVSGKYGKVKYEPRRDGMSGESAVYANYHLFSNDGKYTPYWAGERPMGSSYNSVEDAVKGIDAFIDRQRKDGKMLYMKPVNEASYGEAFDKEGGPFWYFTRHAVQPGAVPKGIQILDIIDCADGSGAYFKSDKVLTTKELNDFEIVEKKPEGLKESLESEDGWSEEILDIVDPFFIEVEKVAYELRNTVRGAYRFGTTVKDLAQVFRGFSETTDDIANELDDNQEHLEEDWCSIKEEPHEECVGNNCTDEHDLFPEEKYFTIVVTRSDDGEDEIIDDVTKEIADKYIDDLKRDNDEFFSHAKVLDHNGEVVNSWEYLEEAAKSKKSSSIKDRLKKLIPDLDI